MKFFLSFSGYLKSSLCWCWLAHDVLVGFEDAKLLNPQAEVAKSSQHLLWFFKKCLTSCLIILWLINVIAFELACSILFIPLVPTKGDDGFTH